MLHIPIRRAAALLLAASLAVVALPGIATAHAELKTASPADKSTVTAPVTVVSGIYTEAMTPDGSSIVVKDASGATVAKGTVDPANTSRMVATPATPLGTGTYAVAWTSVALDGHVERGTWTFKVAVAPTPSPTPVPTVAPSAAPSGTPAASATTAPTAGPGHAGPHDRPDTGAIGRWQLDGEWRRCRPADHHRPDRARRGCGVPLQPTRTAPDRPDVTRGGPARLARRVGGALGALVGLALVLPTVVAAHTLNPTYTSRLPLAVYLVGAALTVGLSFAFVIVRDVRAAPPDLTATGHLPPRLLRLALRAIGLIGWGWIIAQGLAGGSSEGDVATLFLWVYGWVGLAIVCAVVGPAWQFLDPFSTLHDLGAAVLRRLGVQGWAPADYPVRLGRWPATIGFVGFVWLELVVRGRSVDALRRAHRLHGVHDRDDGPVRARRVAVAGRDLHGLVPSPRAARPLATRRRGRQGRDPDVRQRAAGARLVGRGRDARRPRCLVDHLRRAVADPGVLRPVRRAGTRREDRAAHRLPRDRRPPGVRRRRGRSGSGRSAPGCCRSRSAT